MSKDERFSQNAEGTLYIEDLGYTLNELYIKAQEKWGDDIDLEDVKVEYEHRQVKCFGYDQYDSSDYRNYFVLTKVA